MRIGSTAFSLPPFARGVDAAAAAEAAGDDWIVYWDQMNISFPRSILTPDITSLMNVLDDPDAYFDCGPLIGVAASRAERIEFGYAVIDVVRRHPSLIAQTLNTLDHATRGRVFTVLASGENKQMKPYGIARKGAADKLQDAVPMVKALLAGNEPVTMEGKAYKLDRARVSLQPYGPTPPPVLVAGGGPDTLRLVGEQADGWMTYAPGGLENDATQFTDDVATIRAHAASAGRDPDELRFVQTLICLMHDDESVIPTLRAHPLMRWNAMMVTPTSKTFEKWGMPHPYGYDWMFSRDCIPPWVSREEALDVIERTPIEAVDRTHFVGTPQQVLERARPFLEGGATDVLLINYADFCGLEYAAGSTRAKTALNQELRRL